MTAFQCLSVPASHEYNHSLNPFGYPSSGSWVPVSCGQCVHQALAVVAALMCFQIPIANTQAGLGLRHWIQYKAGEWGWCVLGQEETSQCHGPHSHYSREQRVLAWSATGSWGSRTGTSSCCWTESPLLSFQNVHLFASRS